VDGKLGVKSTAQSLVAAALKDYLPPLRASLAYAPALVIPGIASLAVYPLLARAMSSDQLGTYALVAGLIAASPIVCSYWLESAIVRYHFEAGAGLSAPALLRGTILAIVATALLTLLAAFVTTSDLGLAAIAALMSAVVVQFSLRVAQLRARGDFARYGAFLSVRSVAGLPLAFLGGLSAGPAGAVVGQHISQLALGPFARAAPPPRPMTSTMSLGRAFSYGLPVSLMNIAAVVLSVGDRYVIQITQPLAQVAVYASAYMVLEQAFRLIPVAANAGIAPSVFNAWSRGHRSQGQATILRVLALVMAGELLLFSAAIIFADKWTAVLGPEYSGARLLVVPLGLGLLMHAATHITHLVYLAQERTRALAVNFGVASLANILANLAVVPAFGIVGAAWTTTATYGLLLVLTLARLQLHADLARDDSDLQATSKSP
jgi:O-antigen/teichoic acid export membrane protein